MFTSDYAPVRITLVIQPNPPEPVEPEEGADTDGKPVEGSEEEPAAKPNDETPAEPEEESPGSLVARPHKALAILTQDVPVFMEDFYEHRDINILMCPMDDNPSPAGDKPRDLR